MACMPCSTLVLTVPWGCLLALALFGHIPFVRLGPGHGGPSEWGGGGQKR